MSIITPHDVIRAIQANAWSMDLPTFARRLGQDAADIGVQAQFTAFQAAACSLGELNPRTIAVITARPQEARPS